MIQVTGLDGRRGAPANPDRGGQPILGGARFANQAMKAQACPLTATLVRNVDERSKALLPR
jgi:hypothetical protein